MAQQHGLAMILKRFESPRGLAIIAPIPPFSAKIFNPKVQG
jgi:hypothetical protein